MLDFIKNNKLQLIFWLKTTVFFLITALYLIRALNEFNYSYIEGDGFEYVLMTEALSNHLTPDLRKSDVVSFKQNIERTESFENFPKNQEVLRLLDDNVYKQGNFKDNFNCFFKNKNNKLICYHFFTYSLFCVPAHYACKLFQLSSLKAFYLTNAFLVIVTCFLLLFKFSKNDVLSLSSAICFCFSSVYWYLGWEHTEVFTTCLVAIALILYFTKRPLIGLLILSIAVTQNQPLLIAFLGLSGVFAIKSKFNFKVLLKLFFISLIAIIPPVFYYINFNTTSLINELGFLNQQFVTVNRVIGFYFDLNQGMILAMPLILITYVGLFFARAILIVKKPTFDLILPITCIVMTVVASSMGNWNPGQTIVHRYTTWIGAIIFIHTFYMLEKTTNSIRLFLLVSFAATQIFICLHFQKINKLDWEPATHKEIARWVFEKYPDLYNPDPMIFSVRTVLEYNIINSKEPIVYFDKYARVKKVMYNVNNIYGLNKLGIKETEHTRLKEYNNNFGWAYLKERDLRLLNSSEVIFNEIRREKFKYKKNNMFNNNTLLVEKTKLAKEWDISVDSIINLQVEYELSEEEKVKYPNKTW